MTKPPKGSRFEELRRRAEELLKDRGVNVAEFSDDALLSVFHELEVHQIELQMQNEQLRLAHRELEESRKAYVDLYDRAPIGYVTLSGGGIVIQANLKALDMLQISREQLVGRGFSSFVHPADRGAYHALIREVAGENKRVPMGEIRLLRAKTEPFHARVEVAVAKDDLGRFEGWSIVFGDISDLVQSEEALTRERERLRDVLDMLPASVALLTPDHRISFVNRLFQERFGDCDGRRGFELLFGSSEPCESCETRVVLDTDAPRRWELIGPDGGNYDFFAFPFIDTDGSRLILAVGIDITELRQAETALRSSESELRKNLELLQQVVDGLIDPLVMLDKNGLVEMVNKAAIDYQGTEQAADLIGKPCYQGLSGKETPFAECEYPFPPAAKQVLTFERKGHYDSGKVEKVTIYPVLDDSGERDSVIVKISDVTQERLLERQMSQNEKLASLGLLTSGVAHEINNPNSFIYFNIPILKKYLQELLPIVDEYAALHPELEVLHMSYEELKKDIFKLLENMEHGSQRINKIVGVLGRFVRKRADGELQRTDLKQVIGKVVDLCDAELRRSIRSFEVLIPESFPSVVTDPDALEQILLNLLINAIQACDKEDSRIQLKVDRDLLGRGDLILEVTDNGSGIAEEIRGRIFDPFFSTKASSSGTGLGLYLCHNQVSALGGSIEVESVVGQGSTFRVVLPWTGER